MIRPITVICWILALASGLYLYRAKHETAVLDRRIDQVAKQTEDLRLQSRQLLDDWIRLGEPERLHQYSDEYLGLKPIAPTQFARLSDLPNLLPPARVDPPTQPSDVVADAAPDGAAGAAKGGATDAAMPADQAATSPAPPDQPSAAGDGADATSEADADDLPVPPIPPAVPPPVTPVSFQATTAIPLQARPVTPRPVANGEDPDSSRDSGRSRPAMPAHAVEEPRPEQSAHIAEEPRPIEQRPAVRDVADRPVITPVNPPAPAPGWQSRGLPPLQAQGSGTVRGLPPLQAQGPAHQATTEPPADKRIADRDNEPRAVPAWPPASRAMPPAPRPAPQPSPRYAPDYARQAPPSYAPQYTPEYARQAPPPLPAQGTSLLGMSRGGGAPVPLPLPAPTPVSATWPGQGR